MAADSYELGVLEGKVAALESNQIRIETSLLNLGDRVEKSMNSLGNAIREEIREEIQPLRKAISGNGDTEGCLIARVEANETKIENIECRFGRILKIAGPIITALLATGIGLDVAKII
jgi:hypothetical protein